ncbi:MAG: extracellular solute-binding protein [Thermodesulfobacteria bacterium]|nr:extracellular solute-binding protein [Thermodesulfobacteriota bacterium]
MDFEIRHKTSRPPVHLRSLLFALALVLSALSVAGCSKEQGPQGEKTVVVYVSEDQVFSQPVLKEFEKRTGIRVRAVYDTEETKSTGVMNRLLAEKDNPQADVYWANEPIRAQVLKQEGVAESYVSENARGIPPLFKDPDGYWTGFSARARVLIVNKGVKEEPRSIFDLASSRWKGRAVIANPLFGTTTAHIAALFTVLGDEKARAFMESMKENQVAISTSNGESADFVASGRYDFSLVDSDDAVNRIRQGRPVRMVYPDQGKGELGCFIVPNVVVLIKGCPHPKAARKLIDYLLSKEVERQLAFADCAQIPLHKGVEMPRGMKPLEDIRIMKVDYAKVATKMLEIQPFLREWAGLK